MTFPPRNFDTWLEQDVREGFLAPLLNHLGFEKGTANDIIREQSLSLRYPYAFLGRKKPKTDPKLRGEADYICEVKFESGRVVRWIIEAKSPSEKLDDDAVEQAYTYANHPEVGAVYFCLCNAHEFRVFQTSSGAHSPPILSIAYLEFDEELRSLENLLCPESIRRDWKDQTVDPGRPIGPGLRSIVQIVNGYIEYRASNLQEARLNGITIAITQGAIERNQQGYLISYFQTRSPFAQIQRTAAKLGLDDFEAVSKADVLSIDPQKPSQFYSSQQLIFPKGEKLYDFRSGSEIVLPTDMSIHVETFAVGHLEGRVFSGIFKAKLSLPAFAAPMVTEGGFEIQLA